MSALRPGARCVVTNGWARGRHGVVTHTVTQDGATFASVHLDGDLFATVGIEDLTAESDEARGPEAQPETHAGQHGINPFHVFPAA